MATRVRVRGIYHIFRIRSLRLTIINVQDEKTLSLSERMDDIDLQFLGMFLDFPNISLIVYVCSGSLGVCTEVDIKVIDHIGKEFKF